MAGWALTFADSDGKETVVAITADDIDGARDQAWGNGEHVALLPDDASFVSLVLVEDTAARDSAMSKLRKLGLTDEEIAAVIGSQ